MYVTCEIQWDNDGTQETVVIKENDEVLSAEDDSIFFYGLPLNVIKRFKKDNTLVEGEWRIKKILSVGRSL